MSMHGQPWKPLLVGRAADDCIQVIDEIVDAIDRRQTSAIDWGRPLLHTYLGEVRSSAQHRVKAVRYIDRAGDAIAEHLHLPALYGGFSGVGWLCAHTDPLLGRDGADAYDDIDQALVRFVQTPEPVVYDLVGGLVGIGTYFLERLPHPAAREGLDAVLTALVRRAEDRDEGTTWWTSPELLWDEERESSPHGFYNLGVAHGVPGVVGLLAEMIRAGVGGQDARGLVRRAIAWVLAQRVPGGFPAWIAPNVHLEKARVAWCYGGLGVSVTLLLAARALGDGSLEEHAIDVAIEASRRREDAGEFDAGLCHGAAGIAHLFNRLYQATARQEFFDAATFWFARALELRDPGVGVAGYQPFRPPSTRAKFPRGPSQEVSFLTGASGIALAFLAATSTVKPNWDRVLLSRLEPC